MAENFYQSRAEVVSVNCLLVISRIRWTVLRTAPVLSKPLELTGRRTSVGAQSKREAVANSKPVRMAFAQRTEPETAEKQTCASIRAKSQRLVLSHGPAQPEES